MAARSARIVEQRLPIKPDILPEEEKEDESVVRPTIGIVIVGADY
jgi:hypothetical protein